MKHRKFHLLALSLLVCSALYSSSATGQAFAPAVAAPNETSAQGSFKPVLWVDRGSSVDLAGGAGGRNGAPAPPFTFVEENKKGTNPKIRVKDSKGVTWSVKWGEEVNSETFATRLIWALGYFVDPAYFVKTAKINGVTGLDRAKDFVAADGSITNSRFERNSGGTTLEGEQSWGWENNPFVGTHPFNGLRVAVMLVSNWDNKDVRDAGRGSNTVIVQTGNEARYMISDWGGSMGKWGGVMKREKWDCKGYADQTNDFVKGVKDGMVEFGFSGQHTGSFKEGIKVDDVRWLMQYLGRISDSQIRAGLQASGATPQDVDCFANSIRTRINQLKQVSGK